MTQTTNITAKIGRRMPNIRAINGPDKALPPPSLNELERIGILFRDDNRRLISVFF